MFTFLKRKKASESGALNTNTLADIARGMQHAVNSAAELADQQYLRLFELYFEDNDKKQAVPRMKEFVLPNGKVISVPLISLVPPAGLNLERMKVQMAVRIDKTEVKQATKEGALDHVTRTSFQVSFSPRKGAAEERNQNVMDVEMEFTAGDEPEGVARVIEEYINGVIPKSQPPAPPALPADPASPETPGAPFAPAGPTT